MSVKMTSLCLVASLAAACGGEAPIPSEGSGQHDPNIDVDLSALTKAETIATLDDGRQRIEFMGRKPLPGEALPDAIDIATFTQPGEKDEVGRLLDDGATPLEIFKRFAPEGAEAPQRIYASHREYAALKGRSNEIRDYARLPPIGATSSQEESICWTSSTFYDHVSETTNIQASATDNYGTVNVTKTATSSSSKDVYAWMCNKTTDVNCNGDQKRLIVYAVSGGGAGAVDEAWVTDCVLYRFNWTSRANGATYGMAVRDPQKRETGLGYVPTDDPVTSYHALGWQK
jgi:hypothetical protein